MYTHTKLMSGCPEFELQYGMAGQLSLTVIYIHNTLYVHIHYTIDICYQPINLGVCILKGFHCTALHHCVNGGLLLLVDFAARLVIAEAVRIPAMRAAAHLAMPAPSSSSSFLLWVIRTRDPIIR